MMNEQMEAYDAAFASDRRIVTTYIHDIACMPRWAHTQTNAMYRQLRKSVEAYALCLRDGDVPPEHMLVLIKSAMWEAIPERMSAREMRSLLADMVRWSIDAYYGALAARSDGVAV